MTTSVHLADLYEKFQSPIHMILYAVLFIAIVYVSHIPKNLTKYSANIFVRFILFGLIVLTNNYISYMHSLLLALFIVLFLSFSPGFIESFEDLRIVAKKEVRWFDERVLGEDPELMETEKVATQAIGSG